MNLPSFSAAAYIAGQLLRLNKATGADDIPTELSRYAGGHNRTNQPHITGYHQVLFYLPETLFGTDASVSQKWLSNTCESFVPHSYIMNMGDVIGMGQVGASYPTSKIVTREFTLGFREQQDLPILSIIKTWHSVFDPLFGTSPLGNYFLSPLMYKGIVIVAILKPTSKNGKITEDDLSEGYIYTGVYPLTCPEDTVVASEQTNIETAIATVTFRFDGTPLDLGTAGVSTIITECFSDHNYNNTYLKIGTIL